MVTQLCSTLRHYRLHRSHYALHTFTVLHSAVASGRAEVVRALSSRRCSGFPPNLRNIETTALPHRLPRSSCATVHCRVPRLYLPSRFCTGRTGSGCPS